MKSKKLSFRFELLAGYSHVMLCLLAVSLFYFKGMHVIAPPALKVMMAYLAVVALPQLVVTILSHRYAFPYRRWSKASQVYILLGSSIVTMPAFPDRSYCVLLIYMAFFLAGKYGFLNNLKTVLMILAMFLLTAVSQLMAGPDGDGIMFAAFHLFFFVIIGFGYRVEILKSRERNKILREINRSLEEAILNKNRISDQLAAVRLNVKDFSFTPAEKELLELMCIKGVTSNREIADHLNKSVGTIKTQLYSIFEKTGIHKRSKLIAFFREN